MNARFPILAAGVFGVSGVILGASGAHVLAAFLLGRGMSQVWETAVQFQLLHAVALLALGGWRPEGEAVKRRLAWAVRCWSLGIVLFSGSLYLLAAGGPRWLGPITPLGGLGLIAGWAAVAGAALATPAR